MAFSCTVIGEPCAVCRRRDRRTVIHVIRNVRKVETHDFEIIGRKRHKSLQFRAELPFHFVDADTGCQAAHFHAHVVGPGTLESNALFSVHHE